ncbi:single-stranded DNA-binding protein [Streptomyces sp. NPDC088258]|uniref:single-stranded DNA-binding protein n=1 Tax=Streptomyces sp. NPDC088258 TaxID=3365849 RepID=UPI0037FCD83F
MNDTVVTVVGNVATGVEFRESATGGVARFRFAVSPRRWDRRRGDWGDGPTSFYTVWAWRTLGANLAASVAVGEPLVVHGRLRVREEEKDGRRWTSVDIDAVAVGHDLTRGTSAFRRATRKPAALTQGHEAVTRGQGAARAAGAPGPEPSDGLPDEPPGTPPDTFADASSASSSDASWDVSSDRASSDRASSDRASSDRASSDRVSVLPFGLPSDASPEPVPGGPPGPVPTGVLAAGGAPTGPA